MWHRNNKMRYLASKICMHMHLLVTLNQINILVEMMHDF